MSDKNHTPGPWHSFQQADGTRYLVVAGNGRKPNEPIVAAVAGYTATMHAAEEANARLIAAAPDLLAALKRLCKDATECEMHGEPSTVDGIQWDDILSARAAIAKAEGGGK